MEMSLTNRSNGRRKLRAAAELKRYPDPNTGGQTV